MAGFDDLQAAFFREQVSALGLPPGRAEAVQPPAVLAGAEDAALWRWFDAVPGEGPVYAPSPHAFFTSYAAVIAALAPGTGPLDPVAAAQRQLARWGSRPPSWSIGLAGMRRALAAAPRVEIAFRCAGAPSPGYLGLLGGAAPDALGATLAGADVRAAITFGHALDVRCRPGDWYVSSALSLAYASRGGAPWRPGAAITWTDAFGPAGMLRRVLSGLLVVSHLQGTMRGDASFDADARASIEARAPSRGIWPYYLPADAAATTVSFDGDGRLSIDVRSAPEVVVAVAAVVSGIAAYLGA